MTRSQNKILEAKMLRSQSSMHRLVRHHLVVETKPNGDHRPFGFAFGHGHKIEAHTVLDELQHLVVAQRRLAITKAHAHRLTQRSSVTTRQTWAGLVRQSRMLRCSRLSKPHVDPTKLPMYVNPTKLPRYVNPTKLPMYVNPTSQQCTAIRQTDNARQSNKPTSLPPTPR